MKILKRFKRKILSPAELIDKYIGGTISKKEHNYLNWWVGKDPRNMKIFEDLTEQIDLAEYSFRKEQSAGKNDLKQKARRIATLLAGYMRKNLSLDEQCELDEWRGANVKNEKLFKELTDPKAVQLALELLDN